MGTKRRRLPDFEACSLVLFTLLAAGSSTPSRAQAAAAVRSGASAPTPAVLRASAGTPAPHLRQVAAAPPANPWTQEHIRAAFSRSDADGNGFISRAEARTLAPLAHHFDHMDGDGDGRISPAEFREALR